MRVRHRSVRVRQRSVAMVLARGVSGRARAVRMAERREPIACASAARRPCSSRCRHNSMPCPLREELSITSRPGRTSSM